MCSFCSFFPPRSSITAPEVQLPDVRKRLLGTADAEAVAARRKQDYIEALEAANAELRAQWQVTSMRVDDLALKREQDREESARVHAHGIRQVRISLEDYAKMLNVTEDRLRTLNKES